MHWKVILVFIFNAGRIIYSKLIMSQKISMYYQPYKTK